jgi:hypothetical protein
MTTATAAKICDSCAAEFTRHRGLSHAAWESRRFCSLNCSTIGGRRGTTRPTATATPSHDTAWRDQAACIGADPTRFDVVELHSTTEMTRIEAAALQYCTGCPVLQECGATADQSRLWGLWGGTYRRVQQGRYRWHVLVDGAPEPQLTDRRTGVKVGWVA